MSPVDSLDGLPTGGTARLKQSAPFLGTFVAVVIGWGERGFLALCAALAAVAILKSVYRCAYSRVPTAVGASFMEGGFGALVLLGALQSNPLAVWFGAVPAWFCLTFFTGRLLANAKVPSVGEKVLEHPQTEWTETVIDNSLSLYLGDKSPAAVAKYREWAHRPEARLAPLAVLILVIWGLTTTGGGTALIAVSAGERVAKRIANDEHPDGQQASSTSSTTTTNTTPTTTLTTAIELPPPSTAPIDAVDADCQNPFAPGEGAPGSAQSPTSVAGLLHELVLGQGGDGLIEVGCLERAKPVPGTDAYFQEGVDPATGYTKSVIIADERLGAGVLYRGASVLLKRLAHGELLVPSERFDVLSGDVVVLLGPTGPLLLLRASKGASEPYEWLSPAETVAFRAALVRMGVWFWPERSESGELALRPVGLEQTPVLVLPSGALVVGGQRVDPGPMVPLTVDELVPLPFRNPPD